ncbi:MAG: hypothetical protein KY432_11760 [Acidobacteria bacterium]|nr:hypothetical protein [Acidobacteriota bacterium]
MVVSVLLVVCAGELVVILSMLQLVRRCDALALLSLERQLRMFREKRSQRRRGTRREKLLFVLPARFTPDWRERCFAFTPRTLMRYRMKGDMAFGGSDLSQYNRRFLRTADQYQ